MNIIVIDLVPRVGFWAGEGVPAIVPEEGMFNKASITLPLTILLMRIWSTILTH